MKTIYHGFMTSRPTKLAIGIILTIATTSILMYACDLEPDPSSPRYYEANRPLCTQNDPCYFIIVSPTPGR